MNKAAALHSLAEDALGMTLPVRLRLWDGSEAGPEDAPVLVLRDKRAVRHVLYSPGELGVARAYVQGDLDIEGDLADGLRTMWEAVRDARAAISHHYDLSNDFYELVLDPQMAYSSGFHADPTWSLEQAQTAKLDLVCRKLGLRPGMRMLDIGSGWGSLSLHAAEHYGVHVTGVTLSHEQRDFVMKRAAERGLQGRVEVSLRHFRDLAGAGVADGTIDAIASIEMGEHVGDEEYVVFTESIHRYLRPGGRVLIQQMSRSNDQVGDRPGGGPFIETYIAPDMHMKPIAKTIGLIAGAGLEIRDVQAMREHYPMTVAGWARNLEENWGTAVALVGEETARVWRLYLAGGSLAFEENRMGVDQILAVKPSPAGRSDMPLTPLEWLA